MFKRIKEKFKDKLLKRGICPFCMQKFLKKKNDTSLMIGNEISCACGRCYVYTQEGTIKYVAPLSSNG